MCSITKHTCRLLSFETRYPEQYDYIRHLATLLHFMGVVKRITKEQSKADNRERQPMTSQKPAAELARNGTALARNANDLTHLAADLVKRAEELRRRSDVLLRRAEQMKARMNRSA
jgi:hypothetical protein